MSQGPTPGVIERFDATGPRYTSYPTADRFVAALDGSGTQVIVPHKAVPVRI